MQRLSLGSWFPRRSHTKVHVFILVLSCRPIFIQVYFVNTQTEEWQLLFRNSEFHELNQSDQTNIDTDLGLRVLLKLYRE